jgi:hypothetical protein
MCDDVEEDGQVKDGLGVKSRRYMPRRQRQREERD